MYNNNSIIIDNKNVKSRELLVFLETKIEGVRTFKGLNCQPPKDDKFSGLKSRSSFIPFARNFYATSKP